MTRRRDLRGREIDALDLLSFVEAALEGQRDREVLACFRRCAALVGGLAEELFCILRLAGENVRHAQVGEDARIVGLERERFLIGLPRFGEATELIERRTGTRLTRLVVAGGGSPAEIASAKGFEALSADDLGGVVDGIFARKFGSVHPGICQFVFCDGSTRGVKTTIDGLNLQRLAVRNDGAAATSDD